MLLGLLLLLWKCADISMEGEGLSFKFFGDICFINRQSREAWPPFHHRSSTALGDLLTHWGLLMQHTHSVQDCRQLKDRQAEEQNSHYYSTDTHSLMCRKNCPIEFTALN